MGALLLLAAVVAVLLLAGRDDGGSDADSGGSGSGRAVTAPVTEVVDGDTIHATVEGKDESVRYIGIDTPRGRPVDRRRVLRQGGQRAQRRAGRG